MQAAYKRFGLSRPRLYGVVWSSDRQNICAFRAQILISRLL